MSNLSAGSAAEAYIYFRLLSWGYDPHFANGIGPTFDLWLEVKGRIIKIQVKGSQFLEKGRSCYSFTTAKGSAKKVRYEVGDYDIMAMVALPHERAFFSTEINGKRKRLSPIKFSEECERKQWEKCLANLRS